MFNLTNKTVERLIASSTLSDMEGNPVELETGREYDLVLTDGNGKEIGRQKYTKPVPKGYLANGLFSIADRLLNDVIADLLRTYVPKLELYVPQENPAINDKQAYADSVTIAEADSSELLESDFLVAVIDGVEIDSGVAAEIGLFASTGKPIYALYSDVRQEGRTNWTKINALVEDGTENQFMYRNLFVIGLIKKSGGGIFNNLKDLTMEVRKNHG